MVDWAMPDGAGLEHKTLHVEVLLYTSETIVALWSSCIVQVFWPGLHAMLYPVLSLGSDALASGWHSSRRAFQSIAPICLPVTEGEILSILGCCILWQYRRFAYTILHYSCLCCSGSDTAARQRQPTTS